MSTVKSKVQQKRAQSPLLHKTERRRSRSRSRQRMDSELARTVEAIPIVHHTMEYILSTYGVIKDANPLLKQSLEKSEETAYWMRQKASDVVVAAKLDLPLKQLDAAAAKSIVKLEETSRQMKTQWEQTNKQWQTCVRSIGTNVKNRSENFQSQILESVQTMLDHIEETFGPLMLPPTPEAAKYAEDITLLVTLNRIFDITYRLNAGSVRLVANKMRITVDPAVWQSLLVKSFSPAHLRSRFLIIRHEVFSPADGKKLSYMENKELLEVDRKLISGSRIVLSKMQEVNVVVRNGPKQVAEVVQVGLVYTKDILRQLQEAESIRDVSGIGIHETGRALEMLQNLFPILKQSQWMTNLLDWLTEKEKTL